MTPSSAIASHTGNLLTGSSPPSRIASCTCFQRRTDNAATATVTVAYSGDGGGCSAASGDRPVDPVLPALGLLGLLGFAMRRMRRS